MTFSTDYKAELRRNYERIVEENDLPEISAMAGFEKDCPPDEFCRMAFRSCTERCADDCVKDMVWDFCVTAYYGSIFAALLWRNGHGDLLEPSPWEALEQSLDMEDIGHAVESLLNIYVYTERGIDERDRDKVEHMEKLYSIIDDYIDYVQPQMTVTDNLTESCLFAMQLAFKLGTHVAEKEQNALEYKAFEDNVQWFQEGTLTLF